MSPYRFSLTPSVCMYLSPVCSVRNLWAKFNPPTSSNAASPPTDKELLLWKSDFVYIYTNFARSDLNFLLESMLRGVLVLLKFWQFSSELTKTWSSGTTECRVWIGNCNVKVWKSATGLLKEYTSVKYDFANNIFCWDKFTECSVTALFCINFWFSSTVVFHTEYEWCKLRQWRIHGVTSRKHVLLPPPEFHSVFFLFWILQSGN